MGKKIFVSYNYRDDHVPQANSWLTIEKVTVRDYVDELEKYFEKKDIYKGESDDEDLSGYTDEEIWEKLKDRIFDSTVTIVIVSKGMKEIGRQDCSQWIPWEISYSLKEMTRNDRTSHSNAILALILPDENEKYDYYIEDYSCCRSLKTNFLFKILKENMFNIKNPIRFQCLNCNGIHYRGNCSYIESVKWTDFVQNPQKYIDDALENQKNIKNFEITKEV